MRRYIAILGSFGIFRYFGAQNHQKTKFSLKYQKTIKIKKRMFFLMKYVEILKLVTILMSADKKALANPSRQRAFKAQ